MDALGPLFFTLVSQFIRGEFADFSANANGRLGGFSVAIATVWITLWITLSGYRVMTGQSRDSVLFLTTKAAKLVLLFAVLQVGAIFNVAIADWVFAFRNQITAVVTDDGRDIFAQIDASLGSMQLWMSLVDRINHVGDPNLAAMKGQAVTAALIGQATPAMVGGILALLNDIMVRLGIALAPVFILALMFDRTQDMFYAWVKYLVAAMFAMGVLAVVIGICADLLGRFALALGALQLGMAVLPGVDALPELHQSMLQAGLGVTLSAVMLAVPPMVTRFFGGILDAAPTNSFMWLRSGASSSAAQQQAAIQGQRQPSGMPMPQSSVPPPPAMPPPRPGNQTTGSLMGINRQITT
jgi:type IV secretion system protein VirB6